MKKQLKTLMIASAAALLLMPAAATAGKSYASGSYHGKSGHASIPGQSPDYIRKILKSADRIGLNEKQRKQIGELLVQAQVDAARAHGEAELAVAAFRSQLHSGTPVTDAQVNAYTKRMGELRGQRLSANLKASVAASRLLTAEQKAKLYERKSWKGAKK